MYQFKSFSSSSGGQSQGPWDLIVSASPGGGNSNNTTAIIKINPGLIGGVLPTNWETSFTVQTQSITFFIVEVGFSSNGVILSAQIKQSTTTPNPNPVQIWGVPSKFSLIFGVFSRGVPFRAVRAGHIDIKLTLAASSSQETSDSLPFTNYYKITTSDNLYYSY